MGGAKLTIKLINRGKRVKLACLDLIATCKRTNQPVKMAEIGLNTGEFFRQTIQDFIDLQRDGRSFVNIVVVGETGVGKSSTIAEITGKPNLVSHSLDPEDGTQKIEEHLHTNNGITDQLKYSPPR